MPICSSAGTMYGAWPAQGTAACLHETCPPRPLHIFMLFAPQSTMTTPLPAFYPSSKHPREVHRVPAAFSTTPQNPSRSVRSIAICSPPHQLQSLVDSQGYTWEVLLRSTTSVWRVLAFVTVTDSSRYCLCICVLSLALWLMVRGLPFMQNSHWQHIMLKKPEGFGLS